MDTDLLQNQWASVFFVKGFCFVHLCFPAECYFPCFLCKKQPFPIPYLLHKDFHNIIWPYVSFSLPLEQPAWYILLCCWNWLEYFCLCPATLGTLEAQPFCKANFFPAHCCQRAILVCPGSFFQKSLLPCWQVEGAHLIGRERIKGQ